MGFEASVAGREKQHMLASYVVDEYERDAILNLTYSSIFPDYMDKLELCN